MVCVCTAQKNIHCHEYCSTPFSDTTRHAKPVASISFSLIGVRDNSSCEFSAWDENFQLVRKMRLKVLAHGVRNFICVVFFFVFFLFVILSYQNVCYKWENSENRTISDFFFLCQAKVLKVVCKRDWHNVWSYLFLMSEKFWLRVQWP